jgi:Xaa-Pro aminopeptidase
MSTPKSLPFFQAPAKNDDAQVFFAYAILTPEECTLFLNTLCLTDHVREYLHHSGVAVLDYAQFWTSLESFGRRVQARREQSDLVLEGAHDGATRAEGSKGEKIVKTDKVLIGNKASWAVAKAVGEVRHRHSTTDCSPR